MSAESTACLESKLINSSGKTMTFPFLPPHGRTLAPNQEVFLFGDHIDAIQAANGVNRGEAMRALIAYQKCLADGLLTLLETPQTIVQSPNGTVKMLGVSDAGTVTVTDPCWKTAGGTSDSIIN